MGFCKSSFPSGPVISRGFSFDLDLLYDGDAQFLDERIPQVLRKHEYTRRGARWSKLVDGVVVDIDLLAPPGIDPPTEMTEAARGEVAAGRVARLLELRVGGKEFQIPVPDAIGFLALKLGAKEVRPAASKDCFDIFAYVNLLGVAEVDQQLCRSPKGKEIREQLRAQFGSESSGGVQDVLAYASTLEEPDRELVVRYVLDLFEALCSSGPRPAHPR